MQQSMKGFLCSIARQLILKDKSLFPKLVAEKKGLLMKRSVDDWSPSELSRFLKFLVDNLTYPIYIFFDGLDEFDKEDDIDCLLDLIQELSNKQRVKLCVSSRPENYLVKQLSQCQKLRLQDLTAKDIGISIQDELDRLHSKCPPTHLEEDHLKRIVDTMKRKADGVFLWVYYVLRSVVSGM